MFADGVVYNSQFGMGEVHRSITDIDFPKETVIPNGAPRGALSPMARPVCLLACDNYDLPIKNRALRASLAAMPLIAEANPGAELWILGQDPKIPDDLRFPVKKLGYVQDEAKLAGIRCQASVVLHVVEHDNCPNAVVEALGQGIPVVCHRDSGVPEFMGIYGRATTHKDPEHIAHQATAMLQMHQHQDRWMEDFDRTLHIDAVTAKFEEFMESL